MSKGFTLIEIIIVIVILGVLASLALPRLTAQTTAAESAEAMTLLGTLKRASLACYNIMDNFSSCKTSFELGISVAADSKFEYYHNGPLSSDTSVSWWARSTKNTANYLYMNLDNTGVATFSTPPASPYLGIINKTGSTTALVAINTTNSF